MEEIREGMGRGSGREGDGGGGEEGLRVGRKVTTYTGVICGTAYPLLIDIAFIQIHTHT